MTVRAIDGASPMRRNLLAIAASASLLLLSTGGSARAENLITSIQDTFMSVLDFVRSPFQRDTVYSVTPPTLAIAKGKADGFDFWDSLRDAGYEVKEFTTGVGIIPDVKMSFQLAREL